MPPGRLTLARRHRKRRRIVSEKLERSRLAAKAIGGYLEGRAGNARIDLDEVALAIREALAPSRTFVKGQK